MSGVSSGADVSPASIPHKLFPSSFSGFKVGVSSGANIFFARRTTTTKSPHVLLLLHGYPQSATFAYPSTSDYVRNALTDHSLWYRLVPHLPEELDVIVPDLPGYGQSTKEPSPDGSALAHSKREMAKDMLALIDVLRGSGQRVIVYGHDRGARVAYRMAMDHPQRVVGLAALDTVPFVDQFGSMSLENGRHASTLGMYHWFFLAQKAPLPERMIAASPEFYFTETINRWTGSALRGKFGKEEMDAWVQPYVHSQDVIVGACEDYRAGATIDLQTELDETIKLKVPTLILYSSFLTKHNVKAVWQSHLEPGFTDIRIKQLGDETVGHFCGHEAPEETLQETLTWFAHLGVIAK